MLKRFLIERIDDQLPLIKRLSHLNKRFYFFVSKNKVSFRFVNYVKFAKVPLLISYPLSTYNFVCDGVYFLASLWLMANQLKITQTRSIISF